MEEIKLVCKRVIFHSRLDDDMFFKWVKKIKCISGMKGIGDELYLHVDRGKVDRKDLREMLALFYRYNVDMKQLAVFLDEDNKEWFFDNKIAFWNDKVFSEQEKNRQLN